MSFFEKIASWFKSVFTKVIPWTTIALGALNVAAPLLEGVFAVLDPAAEPLLASLIARIQAGLGGLSAVLQGGQAAGVVGLVSALKADLAQLESAAGIKDEATKQKVSEIVSIVNAELTQILGAASSAS